MFKRTSKMTALLVAAASVMSMVPAMAADTTTRLGTKDGTIEKAVSFDGKYIYEGYKGDSDKAVYFNAGDKDKELTDYTDYNFGTTEYADKYILAEDNNDDYLVDLTNGNISEDTLNDRLDSTASKLEKALTKTDKYDGVTVDKSELTQLKTSAKFQQPWYSITKVDATGSNNTIFTDASGKYIDSSVLGNIYAYSTLKQKVVKVEKFAKAYADTGLQVDLAAAPRVIAQDKDNLYAVVNVNITDTAATGKTTGTKSTATIDWATLDSTIKGTDAYLALDLTKAITVLNSSVTVNGRLYKAATAYDVTTPGLNGTVGNEYKYVAGNKDSLKAAITAVETTAAATTTVSSYTNGVLTLKSTVAGLNAPNNNVYVKSKTAYAAAMVDNNTVRIGGQVFTYKTTPVLATEFNSLATLKKAVAAHFATTPVDGQFIYDGTSNFVAMAAGATPSVTLNSGLETATNFVTGTVDGTAIPGSKVTNAWYLQKISKAQGDVDSEAYEPKTVTSYQIDNKSLYDNGDANDAYGWLINNGAVANFVNVQVKDSSLYAYKLEDNNTVQTYKLNLKQIKENPINKDTTAEFGTTKLDGYVVTKDGDSDQDFENKNGNAIEVDVNGVLWVLNDGKIVKFDGKDKTTVYTCDSGFDQLSVYDGKNLVAWSYDDERYTTVSEGTKVTADESAVVAPVIVTGWVKGTDGTWTFNDATGAKVTSKWINVGGAWYFLKADGIMATGWYNDNGTWYYLNGSGAMATGWLNDGGTWYYLAGSGAMLANTTVDGYVLGANGAWVK